MGVKLLGKIKIHEIAKEVGLTSKEIIKIANDLGIGVTSHLSAVDEEQLKRIKEELNKNNKNSDIERQTKKESKKENAPLNSKKSETPVIIRREVIISEDEEKEKKNNLKKLKKLLNMQELKIFHQKKLMIWVFLMIF